MSKSCWPSRGSDHSPDLRDRNVLHPGTLIERTACQLPGEPHVTL
jgi:hypothetical protein